MTPKELMKTPIGALFQAAIEVHPEYRDAIKAEALYHLIRNFAKANKWDAETVIIAVFALLSTGLQT